MKTVLIWLFIGFIFFMFYLNLKFGDLVKFTIKKMNKIYTIKKGKHSSGFHLGITFSKTLRFSAMFLDSCLYPIKDNDDYDINKLFGFSTSYFHHKNSARIGWRCNDKNQIELFAYAYVNGKRFTTYLGVVDVNSDFECTIIDTEKEYLFNVEVSDIVDNDIIKKEYNATINKKKDWFFFHYLLYPYFGGNKTAPHTMKILVNVF